MNNSQTLQRLAQIEKALPPAPKACPDCKNYRNPSGCDTCYGSGQIEYTYSGNADEDIAWLAAQLRQRIPVGVPHSLDQLFLAFSQVLLEKARRARKKYGFPADGWKAEGWQPTLVKELMEHVYKGDPVDVAVYSAFAWFHGWSVKPAAPITEPDASI